MKKVNVLITIILLNAAAFAVAGDVLTLTNNMTFSGDVIRIRKCELIFKADNGARYTVPAAEIASIQFGDPGDPVYAEYLAGIGLEENACLKGAADAKAFHGQTGAHVALGILLGPLGVIGAAVGNPQPSGGARTAEMSKNSNLFSDPQYLECYKKSARSKNVGSTAAGWGMWIVFFLLF